MAPAELLPRCQRQPSVTPNVTSAMQLLQHCDVIENNCINNNAATPLVEKFKLLMSMNKWIVHIQEKTFPPPPPPPPLPHPNKQEKKTIVDCIGACVINTSCRNGKYVCYFDKSWANMTIGAIALFSTWSDCKIVIAQMGFYLHRDWFQVLLGMFISYGNQK